MTIEGSAKPGGDDAPMPEGHHHPLVVEKGLAEGSVGLLGGTVLGISSVAPAYALTATIGLVVAVAGVKMPIIFIAGFLPMFFAAYAYREFNRVDPDCGTSFTWTTRAFGPYVGWLGGWVAIIATIIVLANLAGIGVQFLYQLLGNLFNNPEVIHYTLDVLAAFIGPLFGILLVDYYLIKKQQIDVDALRLILFEEMGLSLRQAFKEETACNYE